MLSLVSEISSIHLLYIIMYRDYPTWLYLAKERGDRQVAVEVDSAQNHALALDAHHLARSEVGYEAARRLRFIPLLSSSKFLAFSASKCLQNSSVIQNNSATCCKSLIKIQNISDTTNFLKLFLIPNWGK